jgi:hypothetical protein
LRAGIVRGRSCASVLVIPRRKTSLCEVLHGRWRGRSWSFHGPAIWSSPEGKGERGEEAGGALLGAPWGGGGVPWGGAARSSWLLVAVFRVLFVLNVTKEKGEEKEKEGKEKRKKYG